MSARLPASLHARLPAPLAIRLVSSANKDRCSLSDDISKRQKTVRAGVRSFVRLCELCGLNGCDIDN